MRNNDVRDVFGDPDALQETADGLIEVVALSRYLGGRPRFVEQTTDDARRDSRQGAEGESSAGAIPPAEGGNERQCEDDAFGGPEHEPPHGPCQDTEGGAQGERGRQGNLGERAQGPADEPGHRPRDRREQRDHAR